MLSRREFLRGCAVAPIVLYLPKWVGSGVMAMERLEEFKQDPHSIRIGASGWKVECVQEMINTVAPDLYTGRIDGDYGKLSTGAVMQFQQLRLLEETGVVDSATKAALVHAYETRWRPGQPFTHPFLGVPVLGPKHPELGWLPDVVLGKVEGGKVSWFGGPEDRVDRVYGQAYIDGADSPRELAAKHDALIRMGVLRKEIADLDEWPWTTNQNGARMRAGTSWAMNPESWFCAMPFKKAGPNRYRNENNPRLIAWSEDTGQACILLRADWGPARSTGKLLDVSRAALDHMAVQTGWPVRVCWAPDDAQIGPLGCEVLP